MIITPILTVCAQTAVCSLMLVTGALDAVQPPPLAEMPLFLSWYDPALCLPENGGVMINCDSDPSVMAGGTPVTDEMYGYAAACIPEWFDSVVIIPGLGQRHCLDTGGKINIRFREVYAPGGFVDTWVIYIDILAHHDEFHEWAHELVYGWQLEPPYIIDK